MGWKFMVKNPILYLHDNRGKLMQASPINREFVLTCVSELRREASNKIYVESETRILICKFIARAIVPVNQKRPLHLRNKL